MARARLMDRPEDYARLGLKPDMIEQWEDGRRMPPTAGAFEWWYFDAILDDETKVAIVFHTSAQNNAKDEIDHPDIQIRITPPDGSEHPAEARYLASEASFSTTTCDVRIGPHRFSGDLTDYVIKVAPTEGLAADLRLHSLGSPYRPGTGYIGLGDSDENFFTWFCVVPRGEVSGTITIDGQTREVHGYGYHDHQWLDVNAMLTWNHWLWARQSFDDHSLLLFDFVASERYGFKRFPICFVQDAEGKTIFENHDTVDSTIVKSYVDDVSGKSYPETSRYVFDHGHSRLEYTLTATQKLEVRDIYKEAPEQIKKKLGSILGPLIGWIPAMLVRNKFDKEGIHPSYTRYGANGDLSLTIDNNTVERKGHLIYEYLFPGARFNPGK